MKKYFIHIIFICFSSVLLAQELPQVSISADTTNIRIGEQINYQITVKNANRGVAFPELELDSLGRIEIVKSLPIDTLKESLVKKYTLTSFDSGRYVLPSQRIKIWTQEYETKPLTIDVNTVAVDTLKQPMFEIKAIKNEPYTFNDFKEYLWWILGALALIALVLYVIFRKRETQEELEAKLPPYQLALKKLGELDEKQLWQNNQIKEYYIELTNIVRNYIERELKIPALESTTKELMDSLSSFNKSNSVTIPKETTIKLNNLLKEADLVKFAKFKPLSEEITTHRNHSNEIINSINKSLPELTLKKPKCAITGKDVSETITLYKWSVPIIAFNLKQKQVLVSNEGKNMHLKRQSYFWSIFNPVGKLFMQIPFIGGYLILIWFLLAIPIAIIITPIELLLGKKPLDRGILVLNRNGSYTIKKAGGNEVVE